MAASLVVQHASATDGPTATAALESAFGTGRVHVERGALTLQMRSLVDDGISLTRISSSGATVVVHASATPDLVVVSVRSGAMQITTGGESVRAVPGELVLAPLGQVVDASWQEVDFDGFSFPKSSIGRLLGSATGDLVLRVGRLTPRSPDVARLWTRTAQSLIGEVLQHVEFYESDIIREQAIDALLGITIDAFELSDAFEDDAPHAERAVERAEEFMRANVSRPISVPDVARSVGLSVRGLQLAYKRHRETTPLLRLRQLRMIAARAGLSKPSPATTVSAVAQKLSYTNLGRFSTHYRAEFNENPNDTLRRSRN